jgi:hypothetical protein
LEVEGYGDSAQLFLIVVDNMPKSAG